MVPKTMIAARANSSEADERPDIRRHLETTRMLDFNTEAIRALVSKQGWQQLPERERVGAIYGFVRDRIPFGYNAGDGLPSSHVLSDGYGQCNTKTTLLMSLLRACGIPCRFHGATIDKRLQKGVVTGLFYALAPRDIIHSWAEVWFEGRWTTLEGVILDQRYLEGLRCMLPPGTKRLVGYGVGIDDVIKPPIEWNGADTFIQIEGVNRDLGTFDDPDAFYAVAGQNLSGIRGVVYTYFVRHLMNRRVKRIRANSEQTACVTPNP